MFWSISLTLCLWLMPVPKIVRRGEMLFQGKEKINARIRGQEDLLPLMAVRCINCHRAENQTRLSRVAAPQLNRSLLLDVQGRRGGPPSRYDEPAFCRLLRTGADSAYILIAREMPVYEVNDAQCTSLWAFLVEQENVQ
jgi:hypothetical protein